MGNHDRSRAGTRFGKSFVDSINIIALTLPGFAITYYVSGKFEAGWNALYNMILSNRVKRLEWLTYHISVGKTPKIPKDV